MVTERDYWANECRQSLLFFTRYFYKKRHGRKFEVNAHHEIICAALEKVLQGEITKLIINIAPRYSKTELAVKNLIAHGLALNPGAKFIHLTYAAKLALDNSEEARDIVQDPTYQYLFPIDIKKDSKAKDKWYTSDNGGVYAAAAAGQVTGFGAGKVDDPEAEEQARIAQELRQEEELKGEIGEFARAVDEFKQKGLFGGAIIIDDPIKPEDAYSDLKREKINDRFETTIRNRVNSRNTPIIVIQQRVHERDLSGYLMDIEPGEWTVIRLPCLREDGTALWPLKHTAEELLNMKRINQYVFEAQYQQDPKPIQRGGEFYKKFSYNRNTVDNRPVTGGLPELYNPNLPLRISFDFNTMPYCALSIWQVFGRRAVCIDEIAAKYPNNRLIDSCRLFAAKYASHGKNGLKISGDPSGKKDDTRSEKGHNDYFIIMRELAAFSPSLDVDDLAPPVGARQNFINDVFEAGYEGAEIMIGRNCVNMIADLQFGKEDGVKGGKLKELVKDPVSGQKFQKYHHFSDTMDYQVTRIFSREFARYRSTGNTDKPRTGRVQSKSGY